MGSDSGRGTTNVFGGMFGLQPKTQCAIFAVFEEDKPAIKKATAFALSLPDPSNKTAATATVILSSKPFDQVDKNNKYCTNVSNTTINFKELSGSLVAKLSQQHSKHVTKRLTLGEGDLKKINMYVVQASKDEPKKYEVKRDAAELAGGGNLYSLVLNDSERSLAQNQQLFIGAPVVARNKNLIGMVKSSTSTENGTVHLSVVEFTSEIINGIQDYIWEKDMSDSGELSSPVLAGTRTESAPTVQSSGACGVNTNVVIRKECAPAVESDDGKNCVAGQLGTNVNKTEILSVPTVESNAGMNGVAGTVSAAVKRPESIPTAESNGGVNCVAKQEIPSMAPTQQERLKDLHPSTRQDICLELNVPRCLGGDYKTLAALVNMPNTRIQFLEKKDDPADEVLKWWETDDHATIDELQRLFVEMRRDDLVLILKNRREVNVRASETNDNTN